MLTSQTIVDVNGIRDLKNKYKFLTKICLPKMMRGEWTNHSNSLAYQIRLADDKSIEQVAEYIANKGIAIDNILNENQLMIESSYNQRFFTLSKTLVNVTR